MQQRGGAGGEREAAPSAAAREIRIRHVASP
ncbi:hypothetical protein BMAA0854 [Burkholderia mallei ATCC 23344]|uniref:Uncharacterized protein n=1 Tax=Burkholderia mallei (strain ATCC 23344) TaxID=243160 RepID=A0A0H2XDJ0_BURMA|nr:hypothetical protein BMAA0854 [Burkholderia mallei ATCC 23344]